MGPLGTSPVTRPGHGTVADCGVPLRWGCRGGPRLSSPLRAAQQIPCSSRWVEAPPARRSLVRSPPHTDRPRYQPRSQRVPASDRGGRRPGAGSWWCFIECKHIHVSDSLDSSFAALASMHYTVMHGTENRGVHMAALVRDEDGVGRGRAPARANGLAATRRDGFGEAASAWGGGGRRRSPARAARAGGAFRRLSHGEQQAACRECPGARPSSPEPARLSCELGHWPTRERFWLTSTGLTNGTGGAASRSGTSIFLW